MASCDWFKMWTSKNLMWKFNFDTKVSKLTSMYGMLATRKKTFTFIVYECFCTGALLFS
jgi:hypothetical protein